MVLICKTDRGAWNLLTIDDEHFKIFNYFKRLFIKFLSINLVCPAVTMKPVFPSLSFIKKCNFLYIPMLFALC